MNILLPLPPEQEAEFKAWASRQSDEIRREADWLYLSYSKPKIWNTVWTVFLKALTLTTPVLDEAMKRDMPGQYVLTILQTMTALLHVNAGRPYTFAELSRRSALEDAMTLYDLRIVSLEIGAKIAGVSQRKFIDALGSAGISVFQYDEKDVLAEVANAMGDAAA